METIEKISDEEFVKFFEWLPERVRLVVKSGLADWKIVLPDWYKIYDNQKN